jgi:hypothetical protein
VEKVSQNLRYFCNFQNTAQSKQSRNRRKLAQYGHPDFNAAFRGARVTRLGEFSPLGCLVTFGNFLKITEGTHTFELLDFMVRVLH